MLFLIATSSELNILKLYVPGFGLDLISRLDQWLDGAVRRRVKELELGIKVEQRLTYNLPKSLLTSYSIIKLKLVKCELKLSAKMDNMLPSLQELCFNYKYDGDSDGDTCCIELDGCENMKHLAFNGFHLEDTELDTFLEKLPLLESLLLQNCDSLACVEIYNQHLVKLDAYNCRELVQIRANTPNLKFFSYTGEDPISFISKRSALSLKNASLSLESRFRGDKFNGLIKLLAKLSHSEHLELSVATEKDVMVPETLRAKFRPPLFAVKHFTIEFQLSRLKSPVEVVDSLLWLAPCPESLSVSNYDGSAHLLIKFLYEKPLEGKKNCGCWKSSINCWRHSLKAVTIENRGSANHNTKLVNFFEKERINGKIKCFIKNEEPDYSGDYSCSSFQW